MPLDQRKERLLGRMRRARHVALIFAVLVPFAGAIVGCDLLTSDKTRVERAKELSGRGDYRTAVIELKKVLQNNGNNNQNSQNMPLFHN